MNKKIVIIGSAYPLRGGLATYNERLAKEFINNGDEVILYTFKLQYPSILFPGKSQYSESPPPKNINIKVAINSINPINWIKVGRKIKKEKPDLVIIKFWIPFMGPCFGTILRKIKKNKHSKIISIIDNIIPHENRPGDRTFTKYFVKPVDGFIAMSKSVLKEIEIFTNKPKVFTPHPLYDNFGEISSKESAKSKLNLDKNFNYLLFFGFIRNYKGLDLIIKAMANDKMNDLPVKLIVAGEFYEDAEPYYELIKKLNLHDKIILRTDFIPDEKVADYFNAADLIVQPYKSATQSGVTQIAYHFNKPVLVTNVGGLAEIIPHGKVGYVVNIDPDDITLSIIDFYKESREKEFLPNILEQKKKYSWDKMLNVIFELNNQFIQNDN
ncbi:MAG: glycosyltransferase [Cytophagales bacterium]|nr:glycosyltransferase [Cytophagales bacterium]